MPGGNHVIKNLKKTSFEKTGLSNQQKVPLGMCPI